MRHAGYFHAIVFSALLLIPSMQSRADVFSWSNANTGYFSDPLNWTVLAPGIGSPPPLTTDIAVFDAPGAFNVLFLDEPINASMEMEGDNVIFLPLGTDRNYTLLNDAAITGGSLTLGADNRALNLSVGDMLAVYAGGTLTVTNHSVVTASHLDVAANHMVPGMGVLYVDGAGTAMHITGPGPHAVGDHLNGVLSFRNGATGSFAGHLNLGASEFEEGYGHGSLFIDSGAQVTTASVSIGGGISRTGEFLLDGLGSSLTQTGASQLTVGGSVVGPDWHGTGSVTISDGAELTTGTGGLSVRGTGSLVVKDADSALHVNGNTVIDGGNVPNRSKPSLAVASSSDFTLAAGLTFSADHYAVVNLLHGLAILDDQTYFLRGNSKLTTAGLLTVGGESEGTIDISHGYLNITEGADILNHGTIRLTSGGIAANQTLRVSGGSMTLLGSTFVQHEQLTLLVENGGEISFQDPVTILPGRTFEVTAGGQLNARILTVGPESQLLVGDGGTLAVQAVDYTRADPFPILDGGRLELDAFIGMFTLQAGTLAPGREFPAGLNIIGDYQQQSPVTLEIEIGGLVGGQEYDQLVVSGSADIEGSLEVLFTDLGSGLFEPDAGDRFEIVLAGSSLTGEFTNVVVQDLDPSLTWNLQYNPNNVVLEFLDRLFGDYNSDGVVDEADFAIWQGAFGTPSGAGLDQGDTDMDGDVDGNDFLTWQQNYQPAPGAIPAQAAVPESGSIVLVLCLLVAAALRRFWSATESASIKPFQA